MFWRVRLKLAAWYAVALALILLAIGVSVYLVARRSLDDEVEASLSRARDALLQDPQALVPPAGRLARPAPAILLSADDDGENPPPSGDDDDDDDGSGPAEPDHDDPARIVASDVFFVVAEPDGTVVSNPRDIGADEIPMADLAAAAGGVERRATLEWEGGRYRVATMPLALPGGFSPLYLHIGRSLSFRDRQLEDLERTLAAGGIAGVALAAVGGFLLAGRALVPVRRALETQRQFVSDASHELRTPLAVVRANAELLARHPDATIEDNIDQVEAITGEAEHMTKLVADLLMLARADEGRLELARERFRLDELLTELVRDMGPVASHRDITLSADLDPAEVEADRQRLRQLAVILLDNALKFTPAGGRVDVVCRRQRGAVEFAVQDSGPGVPVADQPRIFDRFYRVSTSRGRSETGGTGLGLAIARWIVEAHGGRIWVESEPARGSRFIVRFPAR